MSTFIIIFIIATVCILIACALGAEKLLNIFWVIVSALIVAVIVWLFMNHWKIITFLICLFIAFCIFVSFYDNIKPSLGGINLLKDMRLLIKMKIRKRKIIRVKNKCKNNHLIIDKANDLLNIVDNIIDSIKGTPESKYKDDIVNNKLLSLDKTIDLLEKYNINFAFTNADDIQKTENELEKQIQDLAEISKSLHES